MPVIVLCSLLTFEYVVLMVVYRMGWNQKRDFIVPAHEEPSTFISVVIPARNERENIGACIESVLAQNYPANLYEVIVVDDHSEDGTAQQVQKYEGRNVSCISLKDNLAAGEQLIAYKKAAIAAGIKHSRGELIVTTDADCVAPENWLTQIAAIYKQEEPAMIVAPVIYSSDSSILQQFQLIDFMSMQGITAATHQLQFGNMCNGANLAFSKEAFNEVGGYTDISHIASGDDYLLMNKMAEYFPGGISYLKSDDAVVVTKPQPGWGGFLQQRIRWASKSGKYNDVKLTIILALVYLFNLALLAVAVAGIFNHMLLLIAGVMLAVKIIVEIAFLAPVARFFKANKELKYFPLLQPLHIIYVVLAGFLGMLGGYKWKGRSVR